MGSTPFSIISSINSILLLSPVVNEPTPHFSIAQQLESSHQSDGPGVNNIFVRAPFEIRYQPSNVLPPPALISSMIEIDLISAKSFGLSNGWGMIVIFGPRSLYSPEQSFS